MKRIKNAFGRFYLKHPKTALNFGIIALVLVVVCLGSFCYFLYNFFNMAFIPFVGIWLFWALARVFWFSEDLAKELPEYLISEAEKILKNDEYTQGKRFYTHKLEVLAELAKTEKSEEIVNELKNWLKKINEFNSSFKDMEKLCKERDGLNKLISEKNKWREKLGWEISSENGEII